MPCSDGVPPAWVGELAASNAEAARLLCFMAQHGPLEAWPPEVLMWYLGHRRIDLARLETPHFSSPGTREEIATMRREVARIEAALAAAGERFETTALRVINRELAAWQKRTGERPAYLFVNADVALHIKAHAAPDDIEVNELDLVSYRKVPVKCSPLVGPGRFLIASSDADFAARHARHQR